MPLLNGSHSNPHCCDLSLCNLRPRFAWKSLLGAFSSLAPNSYNSPCLSRTPLRDSRADNDAPLRWQPRLIKHASLKQKMMGHGVDIEGRSNSPSFPSPSLSCCRTYGPEAGDTLDMQWVLRQGFLLLFTTV